MNFTLYRELLAIRPIRRLLVVGMIARIPHSAAGVLLTLHIVLTLGEGYAAAGAAAAVMTIGIALGAPWRGRRVDTAGLRTALIPSVVSETVIWSIVPHVSYQWLLPLVFVGGCSHCPFSASSASPWAFSQTVTSAGRPSPSMPSGPRWCS